MDSELDLLLGTAIDSLVKLDVLLFLHSRPGAVQRADELSARLRRPPAEVADALDGLAEVGLVERFRLGSGRHVVYGLQEDEHVRQIVGLLHERCHRGSEARAQVVRAALARRT